MPSDFRTDSAMELSRIVEMVSHSLEHALNSVPPAMSCKSKFEKLKEKISKNIFN